MGDPNLATSAALSILKEFRGRVAPFDDGVGWIPRSVTVACDFCVVRACVITFRCCENL